MPASSKVRVLILDDHALFRESLARLLETEHDLEVRHCASVSEGVATVAEWPADLVLLDFDLGNEKGSSFIEKAQAGKVWLQQEYLKKVMEKVTATGNPAPSSKTLTKREGQVLTFVFEGLSNKEIAGRLQVSESSVKASLQQLFEKTGVRTRSQLVRIALEKYKDQI